MSNGDCLFCQIINGQAPANKVYEDENVIAILDIHPVSLGHTLIVPKKHSMNMLDADDVVLQSMILATKKIAQAILEGLGYDAFNLELNNGRIAGQIIPHLHWHIVPRTAEDGLQHWPGKSYKAGEAEEIINKIKAKLS
ncbi:MAG: HIT family hydrolase [Candidatus Buchananbacteria bacterium RBG_13_36_9]|uniref:HIT family hydrolase n=1 Tax=Candidatus Buchananbacteria bacterium RBG_13_36_9 TaxID=1797530 RepID=A0A1G1XN55_9BACT|nr:MAG: HIT family hydrolase [Candidatus Buchananbacteria bacterium RBG_13_36_9]